MAQITDFHAHIYYDPAEVDRATHERYSDDRRIIRTGESSVSTRPEIPPDKPIKVIQRKRSHSV